MRRIIDDIAKDEKEAAQRARSHRLTLDPRRTDSHLAMSWESYAPFVQKVLRMGASVLWTTEGRSTVAKPQESKAGQWGFSVERLR